MKKTLSTLCLLVRAIIIAGSLIAVVAVYAAPWLWINATTLDTLD